MEADEKPGRVTAELKIDEIADILAVTILDTIREPLRDTIRDAMRDIVRDALADRDAAAKARE